MQCYYSKYIILLDIIYYSTAQFIPDICMCVLVESLKIFNVEQLASFIQVSNLRHEIHFSRQVIYLWSALAYYFTHKLHIILCVKCICVVVLSYPTTIRFYWALYIVYIRTLFLEVIAWSYTYKLFNYSQPLWST